MKTLIIFVQLLFSFNVLAAELTVQPVVGYERIHRYVPTVRAIERLSYGVGASYGIPLFSLEAQLTQSKDNENLLSENIKIEETSTAAMLGLKSVLGHGKIISFYLRAGGHARKNVTTETKNNVKVVKRPSVYLSPYAGTGLRVQLLKMFSADAGVTVIFPRNAVAGKKDLQGTLGFSINI